MQASHAATGQLHVNNLKLFAFIGGAHFQAREIVDNLLMVHSAGLSGAELGDPLSGRAVAIPFAVIDTG
ncbi:hypothetical protein D9M71_656890 [compost metagenome]